MNKYQKGFYDGVMSTYVRRQDVTQVIFQHHSTLFRWGVPTKCTAKEMEQKLIRMDRVDQLNMFYKWLRLDFMVRND